MHDDTNDSFALEIAWERPGLPAHVGPFDTREEAEEWARVNIPNGVWMVSQLTYPYLRSRSAS